AKANFALPSRKGADALEDVTVNSKSPLLASCLLLVAAVALADPMNCNLGAYQAQPGLAASVERDMLTVTWQGTGNSELRARYTIERAQPVVRELAVRQGGGEWKVLGENLAPDYAVQTGRRRIDFAGLSPLKGLGVDTESRAVIEKQGWVAFWDAPFVLPG